VEDISFTFQKLKYIYDAHEKKKFEEVKLPTQLSFSQYLDWKGYQDDEELKQAEKLYSKNK
jgi:cation-transporting ATPase 13A1